MFNDANGKFLKDYNGNNRNVQPKYDRDVFYFDATTNNCGKATVMKKVIYIILSNNMII